MFRSCLEQHAGPWKPRPDSDAWTRTSGNGSLPPVSNLLINPYAGCRGAWVRGNLHGHCSESSACSSVPLIRGIENYHAAGARFVAVTDHDCVTDLSRAKAQWTDMTFLEGFEWSASENILFIGEKVPPLYELSLAEALHRAAGLLTVICHPKPSRSSQYWTVPMIMALDPAPVGVEVFNAHYGRRHRVFSDPNPLYTDIWDALLSKGLRVWGFANDDSHDPQDYGCTRTMACVEDLSASSLMRALLAGRFYGSTGLLMEDVAVDAGVIRLRLSANAKGRFIGPGGRVLAQAESREFSYSASGEQYVRFEAEARDGRIFLQPFIAA
ncbi:MAG: hypothetical protein ABSF77_08895 [Spirochaetia bacterium]